MIKKLITPDHEPTDNVIPFKLNPSGTDENWLSKLEIGTCFVCRPKNDAKVVDLMEYHVLHHSSKSTTLYLSAPNGQMHRVHADTLRFSRAMECVDILGVTRPEKEEEDGGSD